MNEEESHLTKKKLLIDLINCETAQIESERRRPGWTSWALLGALATLIWLFVKQVPLEKISWQHVGLLFLTATLTVEFVRGLPPLFTAQSRNTAREPRFFYSSIFGEARLSMIVVFIHTLTLLIVSIHLKQRILLISKISLLVLLGLLMLLFAAGMILSFIRIPQPRLQKGKIKTWTFMFFVVIYIASLIGYWDALLKTIAIFDPSDIRLAAILVLIPYVLILMADLRIDSPILFSLISIRRDLTLDKMDINLAIRQIDIALSGMQVEDLLQEHVREILDHHDAMNNILKQLTQNAKAIEDLLPDWEASLSKDKATSIREAINALVQATDILVANLSSMRIKVTESINKFDLKAGQIIRYDKRAAKAIEEVREKLLMAQKETTALFAADEEQRNKLNAKFNAMLELKKAES